MADLAKIIDELSSLTVMEAAELSKKLEEVWGVTAAAPVAVAAMAPTAAVVEEKTEFNVMLKSFGAKKVEVIRVIREIFGADLSLKDAKDLVESAPKVIKESISKQDAETIKKKLEGAGAEVEIQ